MEGAGKLVDDEALREAMSERGLGTPATRAAIIEGLIGQKYILRDGRDLHVTPNGMRLIELLNEMNVSGLTSPGMTGEWEYKLRQMEQGQLARPEFMNEIQAFTRDIVAKAKGLASVMKNRDFADLKTPCPKCGAPVLKQTDATYECREVGCGFKAKKHIAGRLITEEEAHELFTKRFVGPLEGFKSKFNKLFDAALELDDKLKVNFVFDRDDNDPIADLTDDQIIGAATLKDGRTVNVYGTEKAYLIPDLKTKNDPDGLRLGRAILQQEIAPDQALKLIADGKTDLLKGFISKKTKRPFSARLALDPVAGKISFEFEERAPRPAKKQA